MVITDHVVYLDSPDVCIFTLQGTTRGTIAHVYHHQHVH